MEVTVPFWEVVSTTLLLLLLLSSSSSSFCWFDDWVCCWLFFILWVFHSSFFRYDDLNESLRFFVGHRCISLSVLNSQFSLLNIPKVQRFWIFNWEEDNFKIKLNYAKQKVILMGHANDIRQKGIYYATSNKNVA